MESGIYCIRNLKNQKRYIGQSKNIPIRIKSHLTSLQNNNHRNKHLQNSFNKYGEKNFIFEILEISSLEKLDELESFYISKFNTMNNNFGYNKESGGNANKTFSKESRERMSKAHSGVKHRLYGKHQPKETREKIRKSLKGKYTGENSSMYGKHLSTEAKQKISDANSGAKNGMFGKTPKNTRVDIDDNMQKIAEEYKNGKPLSHIAKEHRTARQVIRRKLRKLFSKEEMDIINKQNQQNSAIIRNKHKGFIHDFESRKNMSKSNNTTGYYRVSYEINYTYHYRENNIDKRLSSKSIEDLRKKVLDNNLEWKINSENSTGYYRVYKTERYLYSYYENKKRKKISSKTIEELKEKVLKKDLEWYRFEE